MYHASLGNAEKANNLQLFMNNKVRVLLGTTAVGMGLDKQDIMGIVHYDLPQTVEQYVQEVGRVARQLPMGFAHTIVGSKDYYKNRARVAANGLDRAQLINVVQMVFKKELGTLTTIKAKKILDLTNLSTDTVMTLLLHFQKLFPDTLKVHPMYDANCSVSFYVAADATDSYVDYILKNAKVKNGSHSFSVASMCTAMQLKPYQIHQHLNRLYFLKKITYLFRDPAFFIEVHQPAHDLDQLCEAIYTFYLDYEKKQIYKLDALFTLLNWYSYQKISLMPS